MSVFVCVLAQQKKSAATGDAVGDLGMGAVKRQRGEEVCKQGITAQAGAAVHCSDFIVISSDDEEEGEGTQHQQYKGLQQKEAGVEGAGKAASSGVGGAGIERVERSRSAASDQGLVDTAVAIRTAALIATGVGAADARGLHTASVPAGVAARLDPGRDAAAAAGKGIHPPATTAAAAYGAVEAYGDIAEALVAAPAEAEAAGGAGNTGTQEAPKQYVLKVTDDVEDAAEQVLELCRGLKVKGG